LFPAVNAVFEANEGDTSGALQFFTDDRKTDF